jgi:hypothetical protein
MELLLEIFLELFGQAIINVFVELFGERLGRLLSPRWGRRLLAAMFSMLVAFALGGLWGDYVGGAGRFATPQSVWNSAILTAVFLGVSFAARPRDADEAREHGLFRRLWDQPPWRWRVLAATSASFGLGVFVGFDPRPLR